MVTANLILRETETSEWLGKGSQEFIELPRTDEYIEIFDFIPIGYLTLDEMGNILNANISAANQLGVRNRNRLIKTYKAL